MKMRTLVFDIECYINYFLASLKDIETGDYWEYEMYNDELAPGSRTDLENLLRHNKIITFNGIKYDMLVTTLFLEGKGNIDLKKASDDIIMNRLMPWDFERKHGVSVGDYDHIDIIELAKGQASLKLYGARLGAQKLQDLPIEPDSPIMPDQPPLMRKYCRNDLELTELLFREVEGGINLRQAMSEEYEIDLRSKSDAQIAEQVINSEYYKIERKKLQKVDAEKSYKYVPPNFVFFQTEQFKHLLNIAATVDFNIDKNGNVEMPLALHKVIEVGDKGYQMGIGGLHSVDEGGSFYSNDDYTLIDIDVTSYYPNCILNANLVPKHIGQTFTTIYQSILDKRVDAKKKMKGLDKNSDEYKHWDTIQGSLKITINGLFGKFGNKYSKVYSPDLMFHTTVTGQLCLFMLIEQFNIKGIQVVSANTDGIVIRIHNNDRDYLTQLIQWWEKSTGFNMEYNYYKSIHFRDVNNYMAVTEDGYTKGKGIFTKVSLDKNPANPIIGDAVKEYIVNGTDPYTYITECKDIHKFLEVRTVKGGAVKDGNYLGKAIRWYHSASTDTPIEYKTNGNQVANSERSTPLMDLPANGWMPSDIDHDWYLRKVYETFDLIKVDYRYYFINRDGVAFTEPNKFKREYRLSDPFVKELSRSEWVKTKLDDVLKNDKSNEVKPEYKEKLEQHGWITYYDKNRWVKLNHLINEPGFESMVMSMRKALNRCKSQGA